MSCLHYVCGRINVHNKLCFTIYHLYHQVNFGTRSTCTAPGANGLLLSMVTYIGGVDPTVDVRDLVISSQTVGE